MAIRMAPEPVFAGDPAEAGVEQHDGVADFNAQLTALGPFKPASECWLVERNSDRWESGRYALGKDLPFAATNCFNRASASRLPIPRSVSRLASCSARGRADSCSQL